MKDKTILEIANSKRIQDAFLKQLNASPDQRLKPRHFVVEYLVGHIKGIVKSYEIEQGVEIRRKELEDNMTDINI